MVDGKAVIAGPQIQLGADEQYVPVCWKHFDQRTQQAAAQQQ